MPKCVECKYQGRFTQLSSPYPIEMMLGAKLGLPGRTNVTLIGFEEEARRHGFNKNDLIWKAMRCQAPGGGPTQNPIVLAQAVADQPCGYFRAGPTAAGAPPPIPSQAAANFQKYPGSGVCDVCNASVSPNEAYLVPVDVYYSSPQYRKWLQNSDVGKLAVSTAGSLSAFIASQRSMDKTPFSAVCPRCIHMFQDQSVSAPLIQSPIQKPPGFRVQSAPQKPETWQSLVTWGIVNLSLGIIFSLSFIFAKQNDPAAFKELWVVAVSYLVCPTPFLVGGFILLIKGIKKRKAGKW